MHRLAMLFGTSHLSHACSGCRGLESCPHLHPSAPGLRHATEQDGPHLRMMMWFSLRGTRTRAPESGRGAAPAGTQQPWMRQRSLFCSLSGSCPCLETSPASCSIAVSHELMAEGKTRPEKPSTLTVEHEQEAAGSLTSPRAWVGGPFPFTQEPVCASR